MSIAERRPSVMMLKEIEVMKIITPGSAHSSGWLYMAVRRVFNIRPQSGSGGFTPRPRKERPEARIIDTAIKLMA